MTSARQTTTTRHETRHERHEVVVLTRWQGSTVASKTRLSKRPPQPPPLFTFRDASN